MQSILRALNIVLSPVLTLFFASRFTGLYVAGKEAGDAVGAAAAGLIVLVVEIAITQGPKHSAWLRRWLDPRSAFEGIWMQDVLEGQGGNRLAVFSMDYERESDAFVLVGKAYSDDGEPWAKWKSTHVFIDKALFTATYRWEGELLRGKPTPELEKSGLTTLELRRPPVFARPMSGEGRVFHVGEGTRVKFRLHRVTERMLKELGATFTIRQLRINERDEEAQLVKALVTRRDPRPQSVSA